MASPAQSPPVPEKHARRRQISGADYVSRAGGVRLPAGRPEVIDAVHPAASQFGVGHVREVGLEVEDGRAVEHVPAARARQNRSDMNSNLLADDHAGVDALFRDLWPEFDRGEARRVFERIDYLWARLAVHLRAEHLQLFPALLSAVEARDGGAGGGPSAEEVRGVVEGLREEHDFFMRELAGAVNAAREMIAQDVSAAREPLLRIKERMLIVAGRLAEHNAVEERQVYLWPGVLLGEAALADLGREMKREIENLPPRFSAGPTP